MRVITTGCLAPPKGVYANGNGYFKLSTGQLAHRAAYEAANGPIPDGLVIDHLCRVRWCCNPAHLEAVTSAENILRGESPPARNARKTHCDHGHELVTKGNGRRHCATCRRMRRIERGEINSRGSKSERLECPAGHPYDELNSYVQTRADGSVNRSCRACRAVATRRYRERRVVA